MRKLFIIFIILILFTPLASQASEKKSLADRLSGKILLQVESYGRAWYVYPKDKKRYYLKDGNTAFQMMREMSLGITNKDLAGIPLHKNDYQDKKIIDRLKGKILLQVEKNGEAWYVNPGDGLRYYLKDGGAAFEIMRKLGLGISNDDLRKIAMNDVQIAADTAFNSVAYTKYDGRKFMGGSYEDKVLPLASLSKLMTALVFYDLNPDWNKQVMLTKEYIDYPHKYVGGDPTSEVDFVAGDKVTANDLWTAMLVASSNQSAAALAGISGLPWSDFVGKMNQKAKELGLQRTLFYDVAGLDAHNVSTAREMALIANAAFQNSKIANTTKLTSYVIQALDSDNNTKNISVRNRNYSLFGFHPEAAKTGFLVEAQRNVALKKNDSIIVVMHALSMWQRNNIISKLLAKK